MTKEERDTLLCQIANYQTDNAPLEDLIQGFWDYTYKFYDALTDQDLQTAAEEMLK